MSSILNFLVFMFPYGSLEVPLVPKSHITLVELFKFTRINKEHFAPFPRFHWNHYTGFLTFLTVSKIVTSTQKTGEPSENIKFSLVSKLFFCFLHVHPFFVVYPLEGQMPFLRFLYILGDPGLLCAMGVKNAQNNSRNKSVE